MNSLDDWTNMGEFYAPHKLRQQEKRRSNLEASTKLLVERGVAFTSHGDGTHLIVAARWDFWPSTGKFRERKGRAGKALREGRGVHNLLKLLEEKV